MNAQQCDKCGKFHRIIPKFGRHPEGIDPEYCERCKVTPEPSPTRCDCRYHDDGTTTTCGIHEPPPLMYYEPEETE